MKMKNNWKCFAVMFVACFALMLLIVGCQQPSGGGSGNSGSSVGGNNGGGNGLNSYEQKLVGKWINEFVMNNSGSELGYQFNADRTYGGISSGVYISQGDLVTWSATADTINFTTKGITQPTMSMGYSWNGSKLILKIGTAPVTTYIKQ